jgi:hypothetical protein
MASNGRMTRTRRRASQHRPTSPPRPPVVTVTRLREGVFSDAFHRDWRDSFDAAVCDQAGGVIGNAEAEIDGHRTFIGTCAGGVRTYHVVLADTDTLISMQALGAGRLGERIVEELPE